MRVEVAVPTALLCIAFTPLLHAESFELAPNSRVIVETRSIDVRILGVSSGTVDAQVDGPGSDDVDIKVFKEPGGSIRVLATRPDKWRFNWFGYSDVDFRISMPRGATLDVRAGSSDVDIVDLAGDVAIVATSGDIKVDGTSGELTLSTTSGDIAASDLKSARIGIHTTSGDVNLSTQSAPINGVVSTTSGDVAVRMPKGIPVRVITSTNSGDIENELPQSASAEGAVLDIRTTSGDVAVATNPT